MADIRLGQTSSGRWVVTLVNNNDVPNGLVIPVTLRYQGGNPVTMDVKKGIVTSATTEWYTPVGTIIDTSQITVSGSKTVGDKTYNVTKVNWNRVTPAGGGGDELTLSYNGGNVSYNGDQITVGVTCTTDWTVTSNATWASVLSPSSGSGNGSVTVSFDSNSDTDQRYVTLTGKTSDGTVSRTLTIYQNGKPAPPAEFSITPSKQSGISAEGETITLTIVSNTSWSLSKDQSWATFIGSTSGSGGATVNLRIDPNDTQNSRKVNVTGTYGNNQRVTVELTQNAGSSTPTLDLRLSAYSIDSNGGQIQVFVENCNTSWTLTSNQDWAKLQGDSTYSGEGNKTVNLSVEPYITSETQPREVTIVATYGNNQRKQVKLTQTSGSSRITYKLTVDPSTLSIGAHDTGNLAAYFEVFVDGVKSGDTLDATELAGWSSDDTSLVTVNASGVVIGNNSDMEQPHSTNVTATYCGETSNCVVTVEADSPSNYYAIFINQQGNPTTASSTVSGAGTVTSLSVSANTDWHITCEPVGDADNWLTIDEGYESGGAGLTQLHLTKTANPSSLATRQAAIKVYIGTDTLKSTCIVTQDKAESVATYLEISVSDDVFPAAGGQLVLTIDCDDSWKLVNFPTWARPSVTSGHGFHEETITVQEYTGAMSEEEDRHGTYHATAGLLEDSVEILQRCVTHETPVLEPHAYTVLLPGVETTHTLGVTVVNIPSWSAVVTSGADWLSVEKKNESIDIHVPNYLEGSDLREGTIKLSADGGEVEDKFVTVKQTKAIINITVDPEYLYDDETIVIKHVFNDQSHTFTKPIINIESNVDIHYSYEYSYPPTANPMAWFLVTTTPTGEDHNAVMQFTTVQNDVNRQCNRNGYINFYLGASEYDPYIDPDDPEEPVDEGEPLFRFKVVEASYISVDPDSLAFDRVADSKQVKIAGYGFYTVEEDIEWLEVTGDVVGEDYGQFTKYITGTTQDNDTPFRREGTIVVKPLYNDDINITVSQSPRMFAVSPTQYNFANTGETKELNIQSQQFWLAVIDEGNEDWVSLDRTSGRTTDTKLNVTVSDNAGNPARGCWVKFYDADDPDYYLGSFRIDQAEGDSITLDPEWFIGVSGNGDQKTLQVIANGAWEMTGIRIDTPSTLQEPNIHFSKTSGNGTDTITVTIDANPVGREIRTHSTFQCGSASAELYIAQGTAVAPEMSIVYNGHEYHDQDTIEVDSGGGDLEFTVNCNNDWSGTLFAYEPGSETEYFAIFPESTNPQSYRGPSGETTCIVRVSPTTSAQVAEGWVRFTSYGSATVQIQINLRRTGFSDYVPQNISDVYITMVDTDGVPVTKQGPFNDTTFGELEGDIVSMRIDASLRGNGISSEGVTVDFGVWDINDVPGVSIDGCLWSNVTQVSSFTCGNQTGEDNVAITLSPLSFYNTAGQQSIAIALRVNVAGTTYYAKLDTNGQGGGGFIDFTDGFYAIYI